MSDIVQIKTETSLEHALPPIQDVVGKSGFWMKKAFAAFADCAIGRIEITLPNGKTFRHAGAQDGPTAALHFKTRRGISKYLLGGEIGFAEAYMDGDIDIADLTQLFQWFLQNEETLSKRSLFSETLRHFRRFYHDLTRANSRRGSKRNISYHYDLGNDFYRVWLDRSMTYSSGDYSQTDCLREAQTAKYAQVVKNADIKDGDSILEIGCGWGGFAEHVHEQHDVSYRGITISREQLLYAQERMLRKGHPGLFDFEDYRDTSGQFDKIISIEMFEAVGEKNWPTYFDAVKARLKPGGKACIQVITIDESSFESYRSSVDFIQAHIFPGGMLPSVEIFKERARSSGLEISNVYRFGKSYARTLRDWRTKFLDAWPELVSQGFDERFKRMWLYYLEYCEVGFEQERTDVVQITLEHA